MKNAEQTATAHNGVKSTCILTVRSLAVTKVTLIKTSLTLVKGKSGTLKAAVLPKNARYKTITWISSDPTIATVSSKGMVKALKSGTVTITARAHNGITATCKVTVK